MSVNQAITLKSDKYLLTKKKLSLALNILIFFLGVSSLFLTFRNQGIIGLRYFTNDGNAFTTIITGIAIYLQIKTYKLENEANDRRIYMLMLTSAVTEAVIFVVVMVGYLPIFKDNPKIWPYPQFCLHVAIPILSALRFIFLQKPSGILSPKQLFKAAIPIGVYGVGIVTALKTGILPMEYAPYSFFDFDSNFLWFFLFALFAIPVFGFIWSWTFYRSNLRAALLWYNREDLDRINDARVKAHSSFDVINSSILMVYCAAALLLLMFSLKETSETSTKVQHEMMSYICFYMLDDYSNMLGHDKDWNIKDGALYKGDKFIGDGIEEHAAKDILTDDIVIYEASIYVQACDLDPKVAKNYDGLDFVCVKHSSGLKGPVDECGAVLDRQIVSNVYTNQYDEDYQIVTVDGVEYYRYTIAFGKTVADEGVGMISIYAPTDELTEIAKKREINSDISMTGIIFAIFAFIYLASYKWIKALEKSYNHVKCIASGRVPEEPIKLGRGKYLTGLERELNILTQINKD